MRPPEHFETERLRLRPPEAEDAPAIFESYAQDPEVTRYLDWRPHAGIEDTEAFLRRCRDVWLDGSAFPWAIVRKEDGRLLGMVEVRVKATAVDVGYVLARAHWGLGYVPEAVAAVRDWAMAQPGIWRFWAVCDVDNHASARVLEKVGMVREGVLRRWAGHNVGDGSPRDCACYALVKP